MDRVKSSLGRGGKSKTQQYPTDLIALGSKTIRLDSSDGKRSALHGKPGTSHPLGSSERKRDASGAPITAAAKKAKVLVGAGTSSILGRAGSSGGAEAWEMVAVECEPADLVPSVIEACDLDEGDRVVGLLCGAIRAMRAQRWKPDPVLYHGLLYLAKQLPSLFSGDCVSHALSSLLRRDPAHSFKSKGNPILPVLAANLLMRGFQEKKNWPENFVKLYVEDALGERVWVDHEECSAFVNNILTAVDSRLPSRTTCPSPAVGVGDTEGDTSTESREGSLSHHSADIPVFPRYNHVKESVEQMVMEVVWEHVNRRQAAETTTRNFVRFLTTASGLVEGRLTAASRLEMWLQNPKLMKPAQELLTAVCVNCKTHSAKDIEVIGHLAKIRLKTKGLSNIYFSAIRELISAHPDNLATLLRHTILNELSTSRNPNNMAMLSVMFQTSPEAGAGLLAEVFQDILLSREDHIRPLRGLLREIVRVLRHDINLQTFCRGLMKESASIGQCEHKDRIFLHIVDLLTAVIFLAVSPAVKDVNKPGDAKREVSKAQVQNLQMMVAKIQRDSVWWLHETVPKVYRPSSTDFIHSLHKVMFMEHPDHYYKDSWPPENERPALFHLVSEVPVLQNTLIRIFVIGLSKDHPLQGPDTLELAEQLLKRAANVHNEGPSLLQADKLDIIDLVFNLSAYHHPESIDLPAGYTPPQLAIITSYWKAWTMLLLLSAHNPTTIGTVAWEKYPTLRALMEMCITNQFTFPPPTTAFGELAEEVRTKELQMAALEKQQILEFESHLATNTITEQTSLLLPQLIMMNPRGPPRKPPVAVLEQLQNLNATHRLGHLLCRSRRPDFLLDIIQRQGSSQSMPWLADLVESSEGSFSCLPVQCLCEFLLSSSQQPERLIKSRQLLQHLQGVLRDPNQDPTAPCEVLEYFLRRLTSPQAQSRAQAIKGLRMVLSPLGTDEEPMEVDPQGDLHSDSAWLLCHLPSLPHFPSVRPQVVQALRQACQVENDPNLVSSYICFLAVHTAHDGLSELTDLDMAQLIVERSSIVAAILPSPDRDNPHANNTLQALMSMFASFLQKAREPRREAYTWSESQDQILVSWATGEECTMHILVVHALLILLNYGPEEDSGLLNLWFPRNHPLPKAYLVDTSEEALLIPDWLKLRMIRSNVERLVDAALTDLEPPQLVLFIQSFGIPVRSMSKLLHCLDCAVAADPMAVAEAVLDKSYMAQLVEVQHRRGATGGQTLVSVLGLEQPTLPDHPRYIGEPPRSPLPLLTKTTRIRNKDILNVEEAAAVVSQLFETTGTVGGSQTVAFRSLQKTLALEMQNPSKTNHPVLMATVQQLHRITVKGCQGLVTKPQLVLPFLRLLITTLGTNSQSNAAHQELQAVCNVLLNQGWDQKSPLLPVIRQFVRGDEGPRKGSKKMELSEDVTAVLEFSSPAQLECWGRHLLWEGRDPRPLAEATAHLLLKECRDGGQSSGLLVDWLAAVEPELVGTCPGLQMRLLFSRRPLHKATCRPYLLTLLTHRASWATLHNCVQGLLDHLEPEFDCTAVLDFLWALTCNPRLWQGREKFTPKHYSPEDILQLSQNQLLVLVQYILEEAMTHTQSKTRHAVLDQMESRLPLLLQCASQPHQIAGVSKHLAELVEAKDGGRSEISCQLLLQLYLRRPAVVTSLTTVPINELAETASMTEWSTSTLDSMSHSLLTAMAATPHSKDWTRRSQEYELVMRKMASVHPLLVLRQLPMLAASLRGRVHLEWHVFRSRHHFTLFQQVMGLLELLQPYIFRPEYASGLEDTLHAYFSLLKYHCQMKELVSLLNRLVSLLQNFITQDAPRALSYLQRQADVLHELQSMNPGLSSLRTLLAGLALPPGAQCLVAAAPPISEPLPPWAHTRARLQGDDVQQALQELDHLSNRRPAVLEPFADTLSELLLSHSGTVRSLAHSLLGRLLRHCPAVGHEIVPGVLRCLDPERPDVLASVLDNLPDLVVCTQEHAAQILKRVFEIGMYSNVNTAPYISKTIALLNTQSGY